MNASRFRSSFPGCLFATTLVFTFPVVCLAQSLSGTATKNNYMVSVQDLKMSSKGQKAFDKGSGLLARGDAAGSLVYLNRAIAEYPEHYKAYYDLGVAHYKLGHLEEAEQSFQKSIDLSGGHFALPEFGMGMLLCEQQDFQRAEAVIERGLESDPGSARGKFFLARAQYGLNRLIDAERSLRQALVRNAKLPEAYALLARVHQRQSNSAAIVKDLQEYLKLLPNGAESEQARHLLERTQQLAQLQQSVLVIPMLTP